MLYSNVSVPSLQLASFPLCPSVSTAPCGCSPEPFLTFLSPKSPGRHLAALPWRQRSGQTQARSLKCRRSRTPTAGLTPVRFTPWVTPAVRWLCVWTWELTVSRSTEENHTIVVPFIEDKHQTQNLQEQKHYLFRNPEPKVFQKYLLQ